MEYANKNKICVQYYSCECSSKKRFSSLDINRCFIKAVCFFFQHSFCKSVLTETLICKTLECPILYIYIKK